MNKKSLLFALLLALFMPWAANAQTLTVCDGTDHSNYVPFEGYNADAAQHNQMIFPATNLTAMNGKEITQMVFYIDQSASNGSNTAADRLGTWTVSLGETEATTLSGLDNTTSLTQVYQGYFDCSTGTLTLAFSSNYIYHGGNLLVDLNHAAASWNTWYFLGVNQTENTAITRGSLYKFLPKTTFSYQTPPTCPAPTLNAAEYVTENQASFSWTENGSATNWVLQYSTSEDFTNAISTNRQGIPALVIRDLQPLTTYYVRVKADCGEGDQSQWSNVISFSTTAVAQNVGDGWSDDFEGTSCGWELINGDITNAWAWGTATNNGGTHALYVSNNGGTTNAYTIGSAAMVYATKLLTFADGKYEFSYDWNGNGESTWDYMRVALVPASVTLTAGTSTPSVPSGSFYDNLPTGWIAVDGGSKLNLATAWQSMSATVNVTAGNYYMVLAWRNDGSGGTNPPAAVDNVSITKVACDQDVTNLAVSEITTSSATLSWDGGEATQWQVAYSTASNFEGATEEIVSTASYNMSGLQSSSTYYVKVRAYCGGEDFGTWCQAISFATACDAITTFPWTETFESYSAGDFNAPCWVNEHISGNGTQIFMVYTYTNGSNSTHQLQLPDMSSGTMTKLMLPVMTLPGDDYLFSIDVYRNASSTSYTSEGVRVYASTDGEIEGATELGFLYRNFTQTDNGIVTAETASGWYTYEFPIPFEGTCYIILRGESQYGSSTYMDNFAVKQMPSCLKPTDFECTAVTTTSATFGWTNGSDDQTAWQICLNGDETNLIMAESNPFTIEDLTASTSYTAKVRAYCGEDSQSDWSNEVSFTTLCEAISTFPWTENFNSLTAGIPDCWDNSEGTTTTEDYKWNYYATGHDGAGLRFNSYYNSSDLTNFLKTPTLSLPTDQVMQLTFWYMNPTGGDFSVYISTDGGATHETSLATGLTGVTTWTEHPAISLADYAGQEVVIVFKGTSNYGTGDAYIYLDDVTVMEVPSCMKPNGLEVTATATTTATLSWTAGANETAWQICLNGDETNLIEANSNPFTVENLTAATAYTAKVRAYCGEEDQSDWSNEVSFATQCEAIVVDAANPFTEGFEGDWTPLCWESIPYIDGSTTRQWTKTTTSSYIHTGAGAAYSGYYGPIYLVMPDLQLGTDGDAVQLTFWSYNSWTNSYNKNSVVLLDGENQVELWTPESVSQEWVETTIDLTEYMGQTISLAFKYEGNNAHGWYVDDVEVTMTKTSFTKHITGYTNNGGYYLIASPIGTVAPTEVTNMITDDDDNNNRTYDLYRFQQNPEDGLEWRNYRAPNEGFDLNIGQGYLYAHRTDVDLVFTGSAISESTYDVPLTKVAASAGLDFPDWNLVGNPFADVAHIAGGHPFYTLDVSGAYTLVSEGSQTIESMQGVFVVAGENENQITFVKGEPSKKSPKVTLNVSKGTEAGVIDRAIVCFGETRQMPKFQLFKNSTKVYIPMEGKDYALVRGEEMGELPVNFKAEENGTYSMNFSSENVGFAYLHLIDNKTGNDVDLLKTPSYSFEAKTTDYESRFKLVFATGDNSNDDSFAFFSNGSFVINNEGAAELQVIDLMGRILSSETINGCTNVSVNGAPGIYMLRLINGDNVKVQKVVVK